MGLCCASLPVLISPTLPTDSFTKMLPAPSSALLPTRGCPRDCIQQTDTSGALLRSMVEGLCCSCRTKRGCPPRNCIFPATSLRDPLERGCTPGGCIFPAASSADPTKRGCTPGGCIHHPASSGDLLLCHCTNPAAQEDGIQILFELECSSKESTADWEFLQGREEVEEHGRQDATIYLTCYEGLEEAEDEARSGEGEFRDMRASVLGTSLGTPRGSPRHAPGPEAAVEGGQMWFEESVVVGPGEREINRAQLQWKSASTMQQTGHKEKDESGFTFSEEPRHYSSARDAAMNLCAPTDGEDAFNSLRASVLGTRLGTPRGRPVCVWMEEPAGMVADILPSAVTWDWLHKTSKTNAEF